MFCIFLGSEIFVILCLLHSLLYVLKMGNRVTTESTRVSADSQNSELNRAGSVELQNEESSTPNCLADSSSAGEDDENVIISDYYLCFLDRAHCRLYSISKF